MKHSDGNLEKWRYRALEATRLATLHKKIPQSYYKSTAKKSTCYNSSINNTNSTNSNLRSEDSGMRRSNSRNDDLRSSSV